VIEAHGTGIRTGFQPGYPRLLGIASINILCSKAIK
jgi:hypothetical protein